MFSLEKRMRKSPLIVSAATLIVLSTSVWAQNACDLNSDNAVNVVDVQLATNMVLGTTPCTANVVGANMCNIVVVQRVTNAVLGGTCLTGSGHNTALSWTASTSANVAGYNMYRGTTSGGPYAKVNSALIAGTTYTDTNVQAGVTYYYVATAVDTSNNESAYSTQAPAVTVPSP
jgi:hypothetical protein